MEGSLWMRSFSISPELPNMLPEMHERAAPLICGPFFCSYPFACLSLTVLAFDPVLVYRARCVTSREVADSWEVRRETADETVAWTRLISHSLQSASA